MGAPRISHWVVALAVVGILLLAPEDASAGKGCTGLEASTVLLWCGDFVQIGSQDARPSRGCCNAIIQHTIDMPCVCHHVTRAEETLISFERVASVAAACGKPFSRGTKCGDYTVPLA